MFFTIYEAIDLVVMTVALGTIFSIILKQQIHGKAHMDWKLFRFSVLLAAPAVVLHELGHKFVALAFAQITFRESLRDIETCLGALREKLYHCGMRGPVLRTTLAYANNPAQTCHLIRSKVATQSGSKLPPNPV